MWEKSELRRDRGWSRKGRIKNTLIFNYLTHSFVSIFILCSILISTPNLTNAQLLKRNDDGGGQTQKDQNYEIFEFDKRLNIPKSSSPPPLVRVTSSLLVPLENNKIETEKSSSFIFPQKSSFRFPDEKNSRDSRTLETSSKNETNLKETGRKASPDVQDIIDGIVKLLGGKVHNPNAPISKIQNKQQYQNTQNSQESGQNGQQILPLNRPYNLFNPGKPLFFPTSKPSRINNRGPVIANQNQGTQAPELTTNQNQGAQQFLTNQNQGGQSAQFSTNQNQGGPQFSANQNQGAPQVSKFLTNQNQGTKEIGAQFEAIPLEALNSNFNLNQTKPPFSLNNIGAPFEQGVPLPQQLVPPNSLPKNMTQNIEFNPWNNNYHGGKMHNIPPQTTLLVPLDKKIENKTGEKLVKPLQAQVQTDSVEDDEIEEGEKLASKINAKKESLKTSIESIVYYTSSISPVLAQKTSVFIQPSEMSTLSTGSVSENNFELKDEKINIVPTKSVPIDSGATTTFMPTNPYNYGTQNGANNLASIPTPALRPGIVLDGGKNKDGYGSVEVVTTGDGHPNDKIGEIFDITVTAKQNYGGEPTAIGQPFIVPVELNDEIITAPHAHEQFVSIDGKRTYFNLHSTPVSAIGSITPTVIQNIPPSKNNAKNEIKSHPGVVGAPTHPFAPKSTALSTSLTISKGSEGESSKSSKGPSIIRRPPPRRPVAPPVRIDTCIVGDESTCNGEGWESCRTEAGVSSCMCRPGYARKRHREPCKPVVSLVLSIRLEKLNEKKLNYNPDYFNPNSEIYHSLEWETVHGLDNVLSESSSNVGTNYIGAKVDAIGYDGHHAVVNLTVLVHEAPLIQTSQVKRELQRSLIDSLTRNRNNLGKSQLWVEGPISAINAIADVNECESPDLNDCDSRAKCTNTYGSFECKCESGYGDKYEKDKRRSGRKCESCNSKTHCNNRGECLIENGLNVCRCIGNYYGSKCDIDGEVLAVAIGASVAAVVIIGLTLVCLCMWSRRWKKEEQKAALMSRTLFGGMASQALNYLSKNTNSQNPYQQHVTMDERLRWAHVNDPNLNGNIYVQNEGMSLHASPSLMESPPMMAHHRSNETCDSTVDEFYEDRLPHHIGKRPKSRSSQLPTGSIYYDLEGESEMYGSRGPPSLMPFPAQFCVPMNPYPHSRGFYN